MLIFHQGILVASQIPCPTGGAKEIVLVIYKKNNGRKPNLKIPTYKLSRRILYTVGKKKKRLTVFLYLQLISFKSLLFIIS
jgi:hypothetical protein